MELLTNTAGHSPATTREAFFEDLYRSAFPAFARYTAKMNASLQDAKDIFHDALIVYYEKTLNPSFSVRLSPEAYVLGIARHLWFRKFRRERDLVRLEDADHFDVPEESVATKAELSLLKFIESSGKRCLELLNMFYFEKASMKEIAAGLGYRTEHSAAVQKFKCISKIRDAVKAQSIDYDDFDA